MLCMKWLRKFKITWFDALLFVEFIIACVTIAYVVSDDIAHARPVGHYTVTNYYKYPPTEVWCVQGDRSWKCDKE